MIKKHLMALAAAFLSSLAFAAGDIYSIDAIEGSRPIPDAPGLTAGKSFQFRIRLLARDWNAREGGSKKASPWKLVLKNTALPENVVNSFESMRPAISVWVSGVRRSAFIKDVLPVAPTEENELKDGQVPYTDLICEYTVQPGDIALPALLDVSAGSTYTLVNSNIWSIQGTDSEGKTVTADLAYADENSSYKSTWSVIGDRSGDLDLSGCNFFVESVSFDDKQSDPDGHPTAWRVVKEGVTDCVPTPMIQTIGVPEKSTKLYVWSENEGVVKIPNSGKGITKESWKDENDNTVTRNVLTIDTVTGITDYPFLIEGVAKGGTTRLILSTTIGDKFSAGGKKLENYITAEVYCDEPPDPNVSFSFENDALSQQKTVGTSQKGEEELVKDAVPVYVKLSKAYSSDVVVGITVKDMADEQNDPIAAGVIAVEKSNRVFDSANTKLESITIKKGQTSGVFYVYPLGGTAKSQQKGIRFGAKLTGAAADFYDTDEAFVTLRVKSAHAPVVVEPVEGADLGEIEKTGFTLPVIIEDNYTDLNSASKYKIAVTFDSGIASKDTTKEAEFSEGIPSDLFIKGYTYNATKATITVTDPSGQSSSRTVTFTVKPAATATAQLFAAAADKTPDARERYPEGTTVFARVVLSQPYSDDLTVELEPADAITTNSVKIGSTAMIEMTAEDPTVSSTIALKLLDGGDARNGETILKFNIVLKDSAGELVEIYDAKTLNVKVDNVVPVIEQAWQGTPIDGTPVKNDGKIDQAIPSSFITFTARVKDAGENDLKDTDKPIIVRFAEANSKFKATTATVSANGYATSSFFMSEGEYDIILSVQDRDQRAADEYEFTEVYRFHVTIGAAPHVVIAYSNVDHETGLYYENGDKSENNIKVKLSNWDLLDETATIKLSVDKSMLADKGCLMLMDPVTSLPSEEIEISISKTENEQGGKIIYFDNESLNGGSQNPSKFYINAEVTNGGVDTGNKSWAEHYRTAGKLVSIQNIDPVLTLSGDDRHGLSMATNYWTAGEIVTINWEVNDIVRDLKSTSFKVSYSRPDVNGKTSTTVDPALVSGNAINGTGIGKYTFTVPDNELTEIVITATDGETRNAAQQSFFIKVTPTKKIAINVAGPAPQMSTRYGAAKGLGTGRIYVDATEATGAYIARQFLQTWSYNEKAANARVYATGYVPGEGPDYGEFGGADYLGAALTPSGSKLTSDSEIPFEYKEDIKNFFYAWALLDENGKVADITVDPQVSTNIFVSKQFPLANERPDENSGYATTQIEAIFSREFVQGDNLGDINADGIPDILAKKYALGGSGVGEYPTDDFADLSEENDDEDYLPAPDESRFRALVPGLAGTWANNKAMAFTAAKEIRGYGDELHDAMRTLLNANERRNVACTPVSAATLSDPAEYESYREFCTLRGLDYKTANVDALTGNDLWSPENPTDPTLADTDDDGLPDGYEYYYWYWAKVGKYANSLEVGNAVITNSSARFSRLVGERFDPYHPEKGTIIEPSEIAELMDPNRARGDKKYLSEWDSDNDGLSDIKEFDLGTNPFHWDTDGDGMPDGWEVLRSNTNPLVADANNNADGDFMAKMTLGGYTIMCVDPTDEKVPTYEGYGRYYATITPNDKPMLEKYGYDTNLIEMVKHEDPEEYRWMFAVGYNADKLEYYMVNDPTLELTNLFAKTETVAITNLETMASVTNDLYYLKRELTLKELMGVSTNRLDYVTNHWEYVEGTTDINLETLDITTNKLNSLTGPAQLRKGTVITDKPIKVPYVDWQTKKDLKGLDGVFTNRCYEVWVYGKKGEYVVADFADLPAGTKLYDHKRGSINLLHHMVYQRRGWKFSEEEYAGVEAHGGGLIDGVDFGTGFNPCTAWYKNDNGYVNSRWSRGIGADPVISTMTTVTMDSDGIHTESNASEAGRAVDTAPFTALDEFLLVNFRERCGQVPHKEIQANLMEGRSWESIWANNTTRAGYQKAADATEEPNQARAADTDGDGAVDGWELYCAMGPSTNNRQFRNHVIDANTGKPKSRLSPLNADDNMMFDDMGKTDLLGAHQEAVGTDVYLAYANCPSVQSKKNVHTSGILNQGGSEFWLNKFWPTDPYNWDTDGDGLSDDEEYSARFIYGHPTDNGTTCIAGGGLNPCSWDTDMDGLPDMWEKQFIGMYVTPTNQFELVGNKIAAEDYNRRMRREYEIEKRWTGPEPYVVKHGHFVGGMDATVPDSYTKDVTAIGEPEILNINRDYDFDGLDPWQEYLTGLIRPFRYDDPLSPWKVTTKEEAEEMLKTDAKKALELWLHNTTMLVDANGEQTCALSPLNKRGTNPNLVFGVFDAWGAYGSKCNRKWDKAYGQWYYFPDGPNHCLREANNTYAIQYVKHPFMPKKEINEQVEIIDYDKTGSQAGYPLQYATTSPIDADSDHDGMDDYYELFHGLNPLYGGKIGDDLIAEAWGNSVTATKNYWIAQTNVLAAIEVTVNGNEAAKQYDFARFPWMAGDPEADADGDGIRNIDEAINPNIQASKTYLHTDPTPLWMTDSTHPGSLVNGFYLLPNTGDVLNKLVLEDEMFTNNLARPKVMPMAMASMRNRWGALKYNFDFEENEGYDSDHDGLSDFQEVSANAANYSDAQHSDDPHRRQAMYFQGNRSVLQSLESAIVNAATPSIELTEFTVECWVKPEAQREQVILERTVKTNASNPGDSRYYRRNFQLGIDALGRFYAAYDHNGTGPERVMATASEPFALGKWYHLAMTYNGEELCLYINGIYTAGDSRGLRPVTPQLVSLSAIDYEFLSSTLSWNNTWDHILKAKSDAHAMIFGASAKEIKPGDEIASALVLDEGSEWAGYEKFYQGYLSEVRIWDGARKASDIAADVDSRKRYTSEDVAANRKAIFDASRGSWRGTGASRHDGTLEPELLYLYNFGQLFASASIGSIAQTPFGYTAGIEFGGKAACVRPTNWKCGFWSKLPLHSLVYRDYSWVPWIPNLVATQPSLDGTTYDSAYMSSEYKGFIPADSVGLASYNFPQTHELYPRRQTVKTPSISTQSTRWSQMLHYATKNSITDPDKDFKVFQDAHAQLEKTMLLPLGFAYVKYCEDFWDDEGATTTWSVIGTDENNNGIGDWWEIIHYGEIYDENGKLKADAVELYHRDIANGQYPNMNPTKPADLYKQVADENKNGLPDWWEELYALGGASGTDDSDNDGLSNYTEYLLSEVFKLGKFNPRNAFSVDSNKLDYFAKVGELYVGEIFTDHDLINDVWERLWDENKISAHSFDANVDSDGDGWSNYAEYRANTNPGETSTPSISDKAGNNYAIVEHPVPVIRANVKYNGNKALSGTLVFKAWNERFDKDMVGSPDAVWTIGASTESSTSEDGAVTITSTSVSHEKFLGKKPMGKQTYYLGGGAIAEGSFKVYFLDKGFSEVTFDDETGDVVGISNGRPEDAVWYYHIFDRDGMLVRIGNALSGNDTIVGTIDYKSGAVTINFDDDEFSGLKYGVPSDAQTSDKTTTYHYFDMDNAYVKMGWDSSTIGSVIGEHVLADADQPGAIASRGYVREGKNSFVCFLDSDGDGKYTPGEQFGFAGGVDVGWSGAEFDITLSETHPVFARVDVYSGKSDREYWYGTESGNIQTSGGIIPGDKKVRVRIFRTLVNGIGIGRTIDPNDNTPTGRLNLENVCVLDKLMDLDERNYIHEGDFIGAGQLDIEWDTLFKGVIKAEEVTSQYIDVTNMTYRIVIGNGNISPDTTNNLVSVAISRNFDGDDYRKRALPIDIGRVETARPTLRWTMEGGAYNSYPVFQVKIYDGATEIYDSGERSISELAIDSNNAYSWQLPICVGDTIPQSGKTFANGKAYTYTVAMLNSKFRYDYDEGKDHVSELKKRAGAFFTNVPSANGACGAASFDVRYYGPKAAYLPNVITNEQKQVITIKPVIRVQAFSSPDFTGTPIGATATSEFVNGAVDAKVIGLPAGTCYFLAFIDANDNGKCDEWETKGWYSTRAAATDAMIAPKAVKMSANMGVTGTIYLEDADTDHDGIPDGYEYVKFGSLGANGSTYIDEPSEEMKKAGVTLFEGLKSELEKSLTKSLSTAKTVKSIMNTLSNSNVAALIMGLEPTANGEFKLPEPTVLENGVVIKSVTFEPAAGAVTMTVAAQAEGAMTPEAAAIYATEGMATVQLTLEYSEDLKSWTKTAPITISVTAGTTEKTVSATVEELKGSQAGFFRVSIDQ